MADSVIVAARPQDVTALAAIERAAGELFRGWVPDLVFDDATEEETFREAQAAGRLWVSLDGDTPVGFALVEMLADGLPHLEEIDVLPEHGRRGRGATLVRAVCEWAERTGYAEVTLTTFRDVPWNMPFYARFGFEVIEPASLRAALAAIVRDEAARGLDPAARVVMRYRCARRSATRN